MIYLITILLALAVLSAVVFFVLSGFSVTALRRKGDAPRALIKAVMQRGPRRAAGMCVVWLAFGVSLHWLMLNAASFVDSVPVPLLRVDVGYARYGVPALESLLRGAADDAFDVGEYRAITDQLLAHPAWWQAGRSDDPHEIRPAVFTLDEAVGDEGDHPAGAWLKTVYRNRTMSDEQLAQWLELEPPPVIGLGTVVGPEGELPLYVEYGRRWQVVRGVVYPVDSVTVRRVMVDGQDVPFELVEAEDSISARGYEAAVVQFAITGIPGPTSGTAVTVSVVYDVSIFARSAASFGPFICKKHLRTQ